MACSLHKWWSVYLVRTSNVIIASRNFNQATAWRFGQRARFIAPHTVRNLPNNSSFDARWQRWVRIPDGWSGTQSLPLFRGHIGRHGLVGEYQARLVLGGGVARRAQTHARYEFSGFNFCYFGQILALQSRSSQGVWGRRRRLEMFPRPWWIVVWKIILKNF